MGFRGSWAIRIYAQGVVDYKIRVCEQIGATVKRPYITRTVTSGPF